MCSLEDDECNQEIINQIKIIKVDDNCRKCEEKSTITLRGSDNYCNDCFEAYVTHKFRATLGKSKLVRPKDKILVGFSGSPGSVALLNLIRAGMQESVHKRLVFETNVIFIDDCLNFKADIDKKSFFESVRTLIESFGFPGYVTSLPEIFNTELKIHQLDTDDLDLNCNDLENNCKLKDLLEATSNETAKQELLKKLRLRLLASAAVKLECCKVFLADDATNLAVDILSNVAVGRGAQLALDVGFVDDRFEGLMFLRPMRDFSRLELDHYLEIHDLKILEENKKTKENPFGSIQQLTENFVLDLESQFTGTVSTVFRTGAKVCGSGGNKVLETCVICQAPLDTQPQGGATAIQATEFSRFISTKGVEAVDDVDVNVNGKKLEEACGDCTGDCENKKEQKLTVDQLRKFSCYGCRLIVNDGFDVGKLPSNITEKIKELIRLAEMWELVKDYLVE